MTNLSVNKCILFVFISIFLCGCSMSYKMVNLEYDDSVSKVISVLGHPDGKKLDGEYETLRYIDKRVRYWSGAKADYYFVFKNGKLVEFGTSDVRSINSIPIIIPYNP